MLDSNDRVVDQRAARDVGGWRGPRGRLLASLLAGLVLVGCQASRPAPVEVRGRPAPSTQPPVTDPATMPARPGALPGIPTPGSPGTPPGTAQPGTAQPGTDRPGAGVPSVPIGPSGRPVRTEPYGLKRAFGEPPREVSSPSGPTRLPPSVTPAAGGGQGLPSVMAATAGAVTTSPPDAGAATAPVTAPTVLPPASTLPPGSPPAAGTAKPPAAAATSSALPGAAVPGAAAPGAAAPGAAAPGAVPGAAVATAPRTAGSGKINGIAFGWPLKGALLQDFAQTSNRGLALGSRPGAAVNAAADGKVIFSGAGPREYGNLVIIKHEGDLLSVYANNSNLAVKEGQEVRRGQKIAEAGTASNRPQLHFEIRQQGKPIDPLGVLPAP